MFIKLSKVKKGFVYIHEDCGGEIVVSKYDRRSTIRCRGCGNYAPFGREGLMMAIMGDVFTRTEELVKDSHD